MKFYSACTLFHLLYSSIFGEPLPYSLWVSLAQSILVPWSSFTIQVIMWQSDRWAHGWACDASWANWNNPKSSLLKMLGNFLVPLVHNCKGVVLDDELMNTFPCPSHSPVSFVCDAVIRELGWSAIRNRGKNERGTKTERSL